MRAVFLYFPEEPGAFEYRRDRRSHYPRRRPRMYGRRARRPLAPAQLEGYARQLWLLKHGGPYVPGSAPKAPAPV